MTILGSDRVVTSDFKNHKVAEDYAGSFKSPLKIKGSMKVKRTVKRFISHEDSINYNEYLKNKDKWKDGNYYNCISITGKKVRMHYNELGGNQVELEGYVDGKYIKYLLAHMAEVYVNVGDIVDSNTILGTQGNTGLVLGGKNTSIISYATHVHFEVRDENGKAINPREYALGNITPIYLEQSNVLDSTKEQLKVNVDKINIRQNATTSSKIIGGVYINEIYDILDIKEDTTYTWYQIKTSRGVTGYIASLKSSPWVTILKSISDITNEEELKLIFICPKTDIYAIELKENEELYLKKA